MRIVRPAAFFHRLGCNSKIGFGEAYMVGDWTATELADLLTPFAARLSTLIPPPLQRIGRRFAEAASRGRSTTPSRARGENIHRHYDLSNELFATFLDETMTLLVGLVRPARTRRSSTPSAARSTASWTWRASVRDSTCWRSARAGAGWPRGRRSAAPG